MQIKSFRDLRVWQAGIELVRNVYELTSNFPRSEVYGLASQMQRAAVSIPSNIAEGHERATGLLEKITSLGRQLFALRNALINPKARTASPGS